MLIFGTCGALRCGEITRLQKQDVEESDKKRFIVAVKDTKTDIDRTFIIGPLYYSKVKEYVDLRPTNLPTDRFLVQFSKGRCSRQVIGKNKIGEMPEIIASYLQLPNPKSYTGHCFRRSAATLLSDSGASLQTVKQLGGWRSDNVAQGYIENSMENRDNIFNGITHAAHQKSAISLVSKNIEKKHRPRRTAAPRTHKSKY